MLCKVRTAIGEEAIDCSSVGGGFHVGFLNVTYPNGSVTYELKEDPCMKHKVKCLLLTDQAIIGISMALVLLYLFVNTWRQWKKFRSACDSVKMSKKGPRKIGGELAA